MSLTGRPSVSLCAWACNEEALIDEFVRKTDADLRRVSDNYEIIVVDDGSSDDTLPRLRALQPAFPALRVATHGRNLGYGSCFRTTIGMATKQVLMWNTVDMFHDTAELDRLLAHLDRFDLVQGVRSDLDANPWNRKLTTIVNYWLIRALFAIPMSEFQNVKVLRRSLMDGMLLEAESGFVNAEIGIKAFYLGARIKEVEITFRPRRGGESKGARPVVLWRTLADILRLWFQWTVLRRVPRAAVQHPIAILPRRRWSRPEFLRGRSG
jgi:glycosyltransferase involved in cell wall biosynthesis